MRPVLLLEIGTAAASLPPVTPPQTQPPSTWTPPPSSPVGLPAPSGLLVEPLADGAKLTWIPSVIPNTKTIVQAAADVGGSPSTWFDITTTGDATYTMALPAGPVWVRLVAILNGIRSTPTAAALASPVSVAAIVDAAFGLDEKVAQEIVDRVQGDVDTAAAAAQALAEDKGLLLGMIDAVSAQVNDIIGADEWDIDKAYPEGDLTKSEGKLYRALQDVPAGTAITDVAYWQFIGNYDSLGDAVAATVGRTNVLDIKVEANEDAIDSLGTRTSSLESVVQSPSTGLATKASIVDLDETNTHIDSLQDTVDTHTDQISAANSAIAGKASQSALNSTNTRVSTAEGTIASQGSDITQLQGSLAGKASTTAVDALTDRVEETEDGITANSAALTAVEALIGDSSDNLVRKSTFEDGDRGPWNAAATVTNVSSHPTLTKAISFAADVAIPGMPFTDAGKQLLIKCNPGDVFDLSADVYTHDMTAGSVRFVLQYFDATFTGISSNGSATRAAGASGWFTLIGVSTAPAGTVYARPLLDYATGPGNAISTNIKITRRNAAVVGLAAAQAAMEANVDEIDGRVIATASDVSTLTSTVGDQTAKITQISQVTAGGGITAIPNPSFELALGDWGEGKANTGIVSAPGVFPTGVAYTTVSPHSGTNCMRFNATSGNLGVGHQDFVPCATDDEWAISWWTRVTSSAGGTQRIYVSWYDASKNFINYTYVWSLASANHDWTQYSATWIAPAGAAYFRVIPAVVGGSAPGNVYYDDLFARKLGMAEQRANATVGMVLDVNGHIVGYKINNDGTTGEAIFVADKFSIIGPTSGARTEFSDGNWRVYDSAGNLRVRMGVWS